MVIDNLLENIILGLEQNDFKFNQRRLAEAKYLGELYNYKMVDSPVIFDTLYRIVVFGHRKSLRFTCYSCRRLTDGSQRAARRPEIDLTLWICPTTSSGYVSCALFLILVACASIGALPRKSSISS